MRRGHNNGPRLDAYRPRLHTGPDGWVRIERRSRDHWLVGFGQPVAPMDGTRGALSRAEAWQDLIMECNYEAGTISNGGRRMELLPGQLVGAVSWLANRWNWTPKTVRGFLDKLENEEMIAFATCSETGNQKGKQAQIISVCNYPEYQLLDKQQGQTEGQSKGKQGANDGQTKGNIYRKQEEQEEPKKEEPPTPLAGGDVEPEFPGLPVERPKAANVRRECDQALEIYNKAANHFGFALCETKNFTDSRRRRLARRLKDVGGVDRFRLALRTLAQPDPFVDFLLGRVQPRDGKKAFRLGLDHFLQTDGNLGDVIARLLDIASADPAKAREPPWAHWDEAEWERQIDMHANGIWPVDKLSPSPASKKTACPPRVIERKRLLERYDENGFSREKH